VRTAIAATAIAAPDAASNLAAGSGGAPMPVTNRARKAGSIIATGSISTGAAGEPGWA
jgi:hypothetical protein